MMSRGALGRCGLRPGALRWWALAVLLFSTLLLGGRSAAASNDGPWSPAVPVRPPAPPAVAAADDPTPSTVGKPLALPPLKAVLIVGPIDGDYGSWTMAEKSNMDLAAAELAAHGVTVHKFYTPNNDWNQVRAAAAGAHFLFYRGHGIYWSPMPSPIVGGFALKDKFVSSDDIRAELQLARNAIVMLYACFSAGTSGNDTASISSQEAQRRVAMYSDPFLDIGAAGYYADWFGDAFEKLVRYLFEGRTLGETYEAFYDFNAATVERYTHPDNRDNVMWLDKDFWDGQTKYNYAFAGRPELRLVDLFRVRTMRVSPPSASYLATPTSSARALHLTVNDSDGAPLRWTASLEGGAGWLMLSATSGDGGEPVQLTLTPGGGPEGVYSATVRITTDTPDVQNNSLTVPVTMRLVSSVQAVWAPALMK